MKEDDSMVKCGYPEAQGLYNPEAEKDSCGVGFVADINGIKSHEVLKKTLEILKNLSHRGAVGADATTGDGSGIMLQVPDEFLRRETEFLGFELPAEGEYAVGMVFVPREPNARLFCEGIFERIIREEGQKKIGWREVPVDEKACGDLARAVRPIVMQVFIHRGGLTEKEFERKLLVIRKRIQNIVSESDRPYTQSFYICSLSSKVIIYKGLILGYRLSEFYKDLRDESVKTAIAVSHERFSTNTFPDWKLAQPFRYTAHNGEINTIRGNINWMNAREGVMKSKIFGEDFKKILPVIEPGGSDSACLDNVFEMFVANGHPMDYTMMMLIPEAWQNNPAMKKNRKAFYEYHARVMEPWDGPATIVFTDGSSVGVHMDRNGLRPARYMVTKDGMVIMASETGAVDVDDSNIASLGHVKPGKILLVDTKEGRILHDNEIKDRAADSRNFVEWTEQNRCTLMDMKQSYEVKKMRNETLKIKKHVFGYSEDEIQKIILHMAQKGEEPISSMGLDTPLPILSEKPQQLFNYFKQTFAQVTNPPIDPIREDRIMSLKQFIGCHGRLLDEIEMAEDSKYILLDHPVLSNSDVEKIRHLNDVNFRAITIPMTFEVDSEGGLRRALDNLCKRAEECIVEDYNIIILSDRETGRFNAPIPSLLALGAVHHHLLRRKLRTSADIIIETGDARDVMHIALLVGYGATAVNPYMVYELISGMQDEGKIKNQQSEGGSSCGREYGFANYCKTISSGLMKIISRMGISTLQSYNGAQIFQALGLQSSLVSEYFTGTSTGIEGIGIDFLEKETVRRHKEAYDMYSHHGTLEEKAEIGLNTREFHVFNPKVNKLLRKACVDNDYKEYKAYTEELNDKGKKLVALRDLLEFKKGKSVPLKEVEPVEKILKRFTISGMSFGSISKEAHETIAMAMNSIGATSNSGEGGEDDGRYGTQGNKLVSQVKQVASGRFGVTANYLVNCKELQIKVAQGAKPGEGGHLPGDKVTVEIAKVRHSVPGIDLISPPPHHDIYSIEDLAQLIFDLKNVNPEARIGIKLVSEYGVGTVAAGVAKGFADVVMISGHDGGTGASPISSMNYVGLPWELGLAEAQQTLLLNNLRSRVTLQVDGKMKSGKDVAVAALLGAEEFGFSTSALISLGCTLCRQCHVNRCQMGIATQDPELRKKFSGTPEHLVSYLTFIAMELREIMAELGFRTVDEMIGRVDRLKVKDDEIVKERGIDFSRILYKPELPERIACLKTQEQKHKIHNILDSQLIDDIIPVVLNNQQYKGNYSIRNVNRSVGTMLSGRMAKVVGDLRLADDTVELSFTGSAGQSFGAFAIKGITMKLEGEANDYLGKGLSGGKIIVVPGRKTQFAAEDNTIAGNTILYGATSGEVYINGVVGQRFCVRNSGAAAVVEGIGENGCEYMTGGVVAVLGKAGNNFAAGMSGGIAYVLDGDGDFGDKCNHQNVVISKLSASDEKQLFELIKKHYEYTKSKKAKNILDQWDTSKLGFCKVANPVYESIVNL